VEESSENVFTPKGSPILAALPPSVRKASGFTSQYLTYSARLCLAVGEAKPHAENTNGKPQAFRTGAGKAAEISKLQPPFQMDSLGERSLFPTVFQKEELVHLRSLAEGLPFGH